MGIDYGDYCDPDVLPDPVERRMARTQPTKLALKLHEDRGDWRKGVELIASALGEQEPVNLSCVRIADVALRLRAELEKTQAAIFVYAYKGGLAVDMTRAGDRLDAIAHEFAEGDRLSAEDYSKALDILREG